MKTKKSGRFLKVFAFAFLFASLAFLTGKMYLGSSQDGVNNTNDHIYQISQKEELQNKIKGNEDKVEIKLFFDEKEFVYNGMPANGIEQLLLSEYDGYVCTSMLGGFVEFFVDVCSEIERPAQNPKITIAESGEFVVEEEVDGLSVDKALTLSKIDEALKSELVASVDIQTEIEKAGFCKEEVQKNLTLRSKFSTSYKSSSKSRKSNVLLALSKFNGKVVMPGEEVSFNATTGERSQENGYKKANVILNGIYVEGVGGGVCQASTTLYGALIRSDLEVVEVNKHSMPASYVPLAFDAMVAQNTSDLRFVNNLDYPIVFKTGGNESDVFVEIYGQPFKSGEKLQVRAEFVKTIPHPGDKIVKDSAGEYSDLVMYKGEYYRVKYPREGYESKAFVDYYINGNLAHSKMIRHEIYQPQEGIIVEGVEDLGPGMTLPPNDVSIIPPQTKSEGDAPAQQEMEQANPAKYNP